MAFTWFMNGCNVLTVVPQVFLSDLYVVLTNAINRSNVSDEPAWCLFHADSNKSNIKCYWDITIDKKIFRHKILVFCCCVVIMMCNELTTTVDWGRGAIRNSIRCFVVDICSKSGLKQHAIAKTWYSQYLVITRDTIFLKSK